MVIEKDFSAIIVVYTLKVETPKKPAKEEIPVCPDPRGKR